MHAHAKLIEKFYSCFARRDYAGMIECYAPGIRFTDPVFTLAGKQVGAMWHMLCEAGKDLDVTFRDVVAYDAVGRVHWEARYTFSATGRRVHNVISGEFRFDGDRIAEHHDQFSFWRWSRMSLGPVGLLLGWTPFVRNRVKRLAARNLDRFIEAHPEYR